MVGTLATLRQLTADLPSTLKRVAREPEIQRETERYLATIGTIKSLDAFMQDERSYQYAMRAFGLQDMAYAKAFVRRILSEGIDAPGSLANKLTDPRFREFATIFNFRRYGAATTAFARTQQGTADRYIRQTMETEAGRANDGVRLALTFLRKAPEVSTPYALLADRALLKVTQVALGLPASLSALDIDRQAEIIGKKLDVGDLKKPDKLAKLVDRFAALWDVEHSGQQGSPALTVLAGNGGGPGVDIDLLTQIQSSRKGP